MNALAILLVINALICGAGAGYLILSPSTYWDLYLLTPEKHEHNLYELLTQFLGIFVATCGLLCLAAAFTPKRQSVHLPIQRGVLAAVTVNFAAIALLQTINLSSTQLRRMTLVGHIIGSLVLVLVNTLALILSFILTEIGSLSAPSQGLDEPLLTFARDEQRAAEIVSKRLNDAENSEQAEELLGDEVEVPRKEPEEKPKYGWRRLLSLASPQRAWLVAGCVALLIRLPFSLAVPHLVSETIGALIDGEPQKAWWAVAALLLVGTFDALLDFWNYFLFGYAQQRLLRELRVNLFGSILRQETAFFDLNSTGALNSRLAGDTTEMANDLTWVFRFTIEGVVRISGIMVYMLLRDWRLGLLAVAVIPLCALINRVYGRWLARNAKNVQTALAEANSVAQESISCLRTVYSFGNEEHEVGRYASRIQIHYLLNLKQLLMQSIYYMVVATFLINTCVQAGILYYGAKLVLGDSMKPQVLLAFMLYQGQLQEYCSQFFNSFTNLIKSSGAGAKVFELLDRKPRRRARVIIPNSAITAPRGKQLTSYPSTTSEANLYASDRDEKDQRSSSTSGLEGLGDQPLRERAHVACKIVVEDVHFTYPSRDTEILKGVSFQVEPGEMVALVGASGSGKSTIFHLLENFYEPNQGRVTLAGVDVHSIDHKWLHTTVALVGQEPVLFSGTIEDNILYGMLPSQKFTNTSSLIKNFTTLTEQERIGLRGRVEEAATKANAHGFISKLPLGYHTEVGERGVQLSGGQKQRIAIARALIQNPSVLLLDEATSALDTESEAVVQEALERAMTGRTVLVIAHRLSTIQRAQRILVLHKGKIVESGTHDDLMKRGEQRLQERSINGLSPTDEVTYHSLVLRQTTHLSH